jgi:hypothetical protein
VVAYFILVLLWLSCKEDAMFGVTMLGVYALLFGIPCFGKASGGIRRRRRLIVGPTTAALGLVWGMIALQVVIPHFRGEAYSHVDRYYHLVRPYVQPGEGGSFLIQFVKISFLHPVYMLGQVFAAPKFLALLKLFGPVLFLSLFAPKECLILLPALMANLLSEGYEQYEFRLHYPFAMLPLVYISAVVGLHNLGDWLGRRRARLEASGGEARRQPLRAPPVLVLAAAGFLMAVMLCRWFGETPLSRPYGTDKVLRTPHHRLAEEFLRLVPPEASLSAQSLLAAHATHRRALFEFPSLGDRPPDRPPAEYILLDAQMHTWPLSKSEYFQKVRALLAEGAYGVLRAEGGYIALRRGHSTARNDAARAMLERYD